MDLTLNNRLLKTSMSHRRNAVASHVGRFGSCDVSRERHSQVEGQADDVAALVHADHQLVRPVVNPERGSRKKLRDGNVNGPVKLEHPLKINEFPVRQLRHCVELIGFISLR